MTSRARVRLSLLCLAVLALSARCIEPRRLDSVLLVTIDTLRADHVSCYGNSPVPTPALDGLARAGARVERAWTTVPLTTPAHASILTGLYPPGHGVRNNARFRLPDDVPTLAALFAAAGRRTAGFSAAFTTSSAFGLDRGFESFDDDMGHDGEGRPRVRRPGDEVVDRAAAWLHENGERPFFLWVHLYDARAPYTAPADVAAHFPGDPYSAAVAFDDAQLGRLLAALEASGSARNTVVVALADHGEGLGAHGEPEHGLLLYEETVRVPMIIRAPGRVDAGSVITEPVSTVDVAPTVLALAGLPVPAGLHGVDLFGAPLPARRPLYAETLYPREEFGWSALYAHRAGTMKYIDSPKPEMYDIASDPAESNNLARKDDETARALALELRRHAAQLVDSRRLAEAAGLATGTGSSDETIARLESLGYVAGGGGVRTGNDDPLPGVGGPNPVEMMPDVRAFEHAQALITDGQLQQAILLLRQILERDPKNPVVALRLAGTLDRAQDPVAAEAGYRALLGAHPSFYLAYRAYSDFLERHDRPRESRALWLRLLSLYPGYVGADVRLAQAEIASGLPADAARRMEQALDGRPGDPDAWAQLGRARARLGQGPAAIDAFRHALARHPTHTVAVRGAVELLVTSGRRAEARALVQELIGREPRDRMLHETLAGL